MAGMLTFILIKLYFFLHFNSRLNKLFPQFFNDVNSLTNFIESYRSVVVLTILPGIKKMTFILDDCSFSLLPHRFKGKLGLLAVARE